MHDRLATVRRICNSGHFRGAESLKQLLEYLTRQAIEHPGRSVKEYQIAVEALGRPDTFDPRIDSSVRVKVARLRAKLADYYASDGRGESLRIEIPKGSYRLHFRGHTAEEAGAVPETGSKPTQRGSPKWLAWAAAGLVTLALGFALASSGGGDVRQADPTEQFWLEFLGDASRAVVVYSNARFIRSPDGAMRPLAGATPGNTAVVDRYTGVGEVMAIHRLDQLFFPLGRQLEVKRALLVDWKEVKNEATVFVGGPIENPGLKELDRPASFPFRRIEAELNGVNAVIDNRDAVPGESSFYSIDDPARQDFAVIRLLHGFKPDSWILVLAGILTFGTQAAVEFVTQPEAMDEILTRLEFDVTGQLEPFECVLEVAIKGGVPVESRIVAFRRHTSEMPY